MSDWSLLGGVSDVKTVGVNAATSARIVVTAGSANVKGSWVELSASTPIHADCLYVSFAATNADFLVDLAVGAAGFEQIIASNLYCGGGVASRLGTIYTIPISIPAGTRISARTQSSLAAGLAAVGVNLLRGGVLLPSSSGRITTYGANTADSGGVSVDPGAAANTKGSYSEVAASITQPIKGLILACGTMASQIRDPANWLVDLAVGAVGFEQIIIENFPLGCNAGAKTVMPQASPLIPISIPAGTRISARAQCDNTTAGAAGRLFDLIVYGID